MATIKRKSSGKIILKNNKVSCTCCAEPGECCMYPAQALADGLYSADDLPDSILLSYDLVVEFECTRSGNVYTGVVDPFLTYTVYLGEFEGEPQWLIGINGSPNDNFDCLINRPYPRVEGEGPVEDQFADTYTIQFYGTPPDGPFIGTTIATRVSLCRWEFTAVGGSCGAGLTGELSYSNTFNPANFWGISIGQCFGPKEPIDNTTPLGRYASADGEWIVS